MRIRKAIWITALVLGALAGGQALMMATRDVGRPAESEFGLGPRQSEKKIYTVMLMPSEPLRVRKMQSITVVVTDAEMHPIDDAQITIDGGMPQHGHGLPTRPRVTGHTGGGTYEIEGVRFNMGGWWEFKVWITAATGRDLVTFNLSL